VRGGSLSLSRKKSVRRDARRIKEKVAWTKMAMNVKFIVQKCMQCFTTIPKDEVPRPLGTLLHASEPNEQLKFDFFYIEL
jgi:hypothetical protein